MKQRSKSFSVDNVTINRNYSLNVLFKGHMLSDIGFGVGALFSVEDCHTFGFFGTNWVLDQVVSLWGHRNTYLMSYFVF